MEYPLQIELNVNQDDFIQVEILEQELEMNLWREEIKKGFIIESIVMALVSCFVMFLVAKGVIRIQTMIFVVGIWMLLAANSGYNYFMGAKREFSMAVQHLLINKDDNEFFTQERGMVLFYEDRCEYLSNEQRRFFDYDKIKHIKITRHLYIFVMKRTKDKGLKGFVYMVIPRRNLTEEQQIKADSICEGIVSKYGLEPWIESNVIR